MLAENVAIMQEKHFDSSEWEEALANKTLPIGLIDSTNSLFESLGVNGFLDSIKTKGHGPAPLVQAMMVHTLMNENSMKACAEWLSDSDVREAFGIEYKVNQKTLNRTLQYLGSNREGLIVTLNTGLKKMYPELKKDFDVDGSAILMNKESKISKRGYPRDKNPNGLQVEFMLGMYEDSRIPFHIREFNGNMGDEELYAISVPEMIVPVNDDDIHRYENISNRSISGIKDRDQERELLNPSALREKRP